MHTDKRGAKKRQPHTRNEKQRQDESGGWLVRNQKPIKVITLIILATVALASTAVMISITLHNHNASTSNQEGAVIEEVTTKEPSIHISNSLADEITAYDLIEDDDTTRMLTVPVYCELSANFYTVNKKINNGTFPGESTDYDGLAANRFAKYGVANCRTELYIGYDLPDGYTIDISKSNEGEEAYLEHHPEESRFTVWRVWDVFADKTLAATGKSTGNKIITIYDETSNSVKRYGLTFLPILHDEDKEFFDAWEKQITYGDSETLRPESPKKYSNYYDNRSY